jgi:hypothetical protein
MIPKNFGPDCFGAGSRVLASDYSTLCAENLPCQPAQQGQAKTQQTYKYEVAGWHAYAYDTPTDRRGRHLRNR